MRVDTWLELPKHIPAIPVRQCKRAGQVLVTLVRPYSRSPEWRTRMIVGYARVSTDWQTLDAQQSALRNAAADRVFAEKISGAVTDRKTGWCDQRGTS